MNKHHCVVCRSGCRFVLCERCYGSVDRLPEPEQTRAPSFFVERSGIRGGVDYAPPMVTL